MRLDNNYVPKQSISTELKLKSSKQQQEQFVQSWFGQSFNQRQLCNGRLQHA